MAFLGKASNFFSETNTWHRPVYWSALTGACSEVKSSAGSPRIWALIRRRMFLVTSTTRLWLARRAWHTCRIRRWLG